MKKSAPTIIFVIVCLGAIIAAFAVGLGIRKIRFAGVDTRAEVVAESKKPAEKPVRDEVAAKPSTTPQTPAQLEDTSSQEEEPGFSGERMQGMKEQPANVSEEEPEPMRESRPQLSEREGRPQLSQQEAWAQLSQEDKDKLREEMRELMDRRDEMTNEEMKNAQAEIRERYGLPSR